MKINFLYLLFFTVVCIQAQRRTTAKPDVSTGSSQKPVSRGRGRSRFVSTPEYLENNDAIRTASEIPSRRAHLENSEAVRTPSDIPSRRVAVSRRRPVEATSEVRTTEASKKSSYAVEETVNEAPTEYFRKSKSKVLTESTFEATNPLTRRNSILATQSSTQIPEVSKSTENLVSNSIIPEVLFVPNLPSTEGLEEQPLDTTLKTNTLDFPSETTSEEIQEITKSIQVTTPKHPEPQRSQNGGVRRNNGRTRVANNLADNSVASRNPEPTRVRARTRAPKKSGEEPIPNSAPSKNLDRSTRRRTATPAAASTLLTPEVVQTENRIKTVRKIETPLASPDLVASRTRDVRRRTVTTTPSTTTKNAEQPRRHSNIRTKTTPVQPVQTFPSRNIIKSKDNPPFIDEQKLEVLPLFESEPKTVRPVTRSRSRQRTSRTSETTPAPTRVSRRGRAGERRPVTEQDNLLTSATENDVKFTKPNESPSIVSVTVNVETRTESSFKRRQVNKKPHVKQSVVSEITEVTSKQSVPRRRKNGENSTVSKGKLDAQKNKIREKIVSSRGNKRSEVKLNEIKKSSSSDEIDESDNYPEPFKALIQAKKSQEVRSTVTESSRSSTSSTTISSTSVVTPSSTTTAADFTIPSTEAPKEVNDEDNELDPKRIRKQQTLTKLLSRTQRTRPISSPIRTTALPISSRITVASSTRNLPTAKSISTRSSLKVIRSTVSPPSTTPLSRDRKSEEVSVKTNLGLSNSARGSYTKSIKEKSANKDRQIQDVDPILLSTKIPKPGFKKSDRYNTKYRSDISHRGPAARSTTNAPVYIPTIPSTPYVPTVPTVTPPTRFRITPAVGGKDPDLGLEVISFDDPVQTLASANLVKGEFASSSENIILPLVKDGTTEKPVSIIERIINSITAIQTTSTMDPQSNSVSTTESNSAILKLATKKSTKNENAIDSNTQTSLDPTLTTEKPTTIIEKILSSLNAIQATDDTNSIQVGKDFNTISQSTTTPLPIVTKSSTTISTLPAQISTSLNPLSILDEITPEQVLQKRTIGMLLDILNGLLHTSPSPEKLVVVTPKSSGIGNTFSTDFETISTNAPFSTAFIPTTTFSSTFPNTEQVSSELFTSGPVSSIVPNNLSAPSETVTNPDTTTTTTTPSSQTSNPVTDPPQGITSETLIEPRFGTTSAPDVTTILDSTTQIPLLTESSTQSTTTDAIGSDVSNMKTTTISTTSFPSTTEVGLNNSTEVISLFTLLSTPPTFQQFKVSPGSVSIFSANDLANVITPEDIISTVTISSKGNFDNVATTQSSTTTEEVIATTESTESSTEITTLITTESGTTQSSSDEDSTTSSGPTNNNQSSTSKNVSDVTDNTTDSSNLTNASSSTTIASRSGKLLDIVQDPVQNSIDVSTPSTTTSTTPDYFIFAVLNNNTVLRKRPPTIPNKETPFLIVGIYPNNTIVRKFPNGTDVPMEQIIRVRGFDTRQNPPPLPEITSNQVTNEPDDQQDNANVQTVEQTTPQNFEANALSINSISSTTTLKSPTSMSTTISTSTTAIPSTTTSTATNNILIPSTTEDVFTIPSISTIIPSIGTEEIPITTESISLNSIESGITENVSPVIPASGVESRFALSSTEVPPVTGTTLPTLSELFNGRTIEMYNNIFTSSNPSSTVSTTVNTDTEPKYETLQVNQYNKVINIQEFIKQNNENVIFRWKPITSTVNTRKIESTTSNLVPSTTIQAVSTSTEAKPLPLSNEGTEQSSTTAGQIPTMPATTPAPLTSPAPTTTDAPSLRNSRTRITTSAPTTTLPPATTTAATTTTTPTTTTTTGRTTEPPVSTVVPRLTETVTVTTAQPTRLQETTTGDISQPLVGTLVPRRIKTVTVTTSPPSKLEETTIADAMQPTAVPRLTKTVTVTASPPSRPEGTTPAFLPSFLTTFFPTIFSSEAVTTRSSRITSEAPSTVFYDANDIYLGASSTAQPTTVLSPRRSRTRAPRTTTVVPTTTERLTTTTAFTTTTTTVAPTTATQQATIGSSTLFTNVNSITETTSKAPKLKELTEQQKKDLETLVQLEKEQAALLQQLSFLTSLNFAGANGKKNVNIGTRSQNSNLANRVVQLAVERDQAKSTSKKPKATTEATTSDNEPAKGRKTKSNSEVPKLPNSILDQLAAIDATQKSKPAGPSIEDVLKQYNLNGLEIITTPKAATYGTSNDAILASILKEQGLGPTTPKGLEGVFETTKRPKRPKTTTQRPPGRLMQGLNWLLNALAPPPPTTTRRPRKPKKPKKPPVSEELLANSPTHVTPVVTPAPSAANTLSQEDVQKLIKQLEGIQKDPSKGALDLSQIKSLQTLINVDEGVQVQANGEHGATSRRTTTERTTVGTTSKRKKVKKSTTQAPILSVSNSVDDSEREFVSTTTAPRAPIGFKPVPGVDDGQSDPLIRGNLLTAAVNVTRAISGFLGSALQDAAFQFTKMYSNGPDLVRNIFGSSSSLVSTASAGTSASLKSIG